ncbi:MAG TPA: zf-HC2 domain-containing protein [Thermodesulfobacteriota bacterium]|nr:zf-HC2 domain-containing protein [Thermodesulfobacteriota bacterium]
MTTVMCKDVVEKIIGYIEAGLDHQTVEELENHINSCPECKEFVLTYKMMLDLTGKLREKKFVTPEIRNRLKVCLKSSLMRK